MQRTCLKCGLENRNAEGKDTDACPNCGAIYSRVEKAQETASRQQLLDAERASRDRSTFGRILAGSGLVVGIVLVVVILMVILALGHAFGNLLSHPGSGA